MKARIGRLRGAFGERDPLLMVLSVAAVIGLGVLLGQQYLFPDKRVIAVGAAAIMIGIAWRLDLVSAIGLLAIALPFPRGTVFGSSNIALILLLLIVWLLRFTQREAPGPRRTPVDQAIVLLVLAYVLSFYNVSSTLALERGLQAVVLFLSCVMMFYLIVNNIRSERDLRRFHMFQIAAIALIHLYCYWELAFPGTVLIPGWIDLRGIGPEVNQVRNYRVGGPWIDYELLSEFVAMSIPFFLFRFVQARTVSQRVIALGMLLSSVAIMFATVTRGGLLALLVGLAYLAFVMRRRAHVVPVTIYGGLAIGLLSGVGWLVRQFTVSGDLFARLVGTKFVGLAPESRAEVWPLAFQRWLNHPILGHGPYYAPEHGLKVWFWPHDLPLYLANCFGIIGLAAFSWMIWKFWQLSRPQTDRLDDPGYARSFQLVTRVQLLIFMVDEIKIEYLRNQTYQFQVWLMFAALAATGVLLQRAEAPVRERASHPAGALPARS